MKRIYGITAAVAGLVLTLTACGSSGSSAGSSTSAPAGTTAASTSAAGSTSASAPAASGGSIVVGSAQFPESELLANIYADALKAKGVKASTHLDIGERSVYLAALKAGSISFFPEYSGSLLDFENPKATAKTPAAVYAALPAALPSTLTVLKYAPAQDSDTITVTAATASKYHLKSIADLKAVASKLTLGAPAQFQTRPDGIPALKSVYGVTFGRFTKLGTAGTITVNALKNGSIDAADIFSTDSSIAANHFVSLTDPKSMFAAQNIIPVVTKSKVTPAVTAAANAVSAKLDTKTLAALVAKVSNGNSNTVAEAWLKSVGLG
jgi:osmoprotectant transport system substrate-binding protein